MYFERDTLTYLGQDYRNYEDDQIDEFKEDIADLSNRLATENPKQKKWQKQ
jgi:hypothetical protein